MELMSFTPIVPGTDLSETPIKSGCTTKQALHSWAFFFARRLDKKVAGRWLETYFVKPDSPYLTLSVFPLKGSFVRHANLLPAKIVRYRAAYFSQEE